MCVRLTYTDVCGAPPLLGWWWVGNVYYGSGLPPGATLYGCGVAWLARPDQRRPEIGDRRASRLMLRALTGSALIARYVCDMCRMRGPSRRLLS